MEKIFMPRPPKNEAPEPAAVPEFRPKLKKLIENTANEWSVRAQDLFKKLGHLANIEPKKAIELIEKLPEAKDQLIVENTNGQAGAFPQNELPGAGETEAHVLDKMKHNQVDQPKEHTLSENHVRVTNELPRDISAQLGEWTLENQLRKSSDEKTERQYIVLEKDGKNLGFTALDVRGDTAELIFRWISPEDRGKGSGRELRSKVLDWAKENGLKQIHVKEIESVIEFDRNGSAQWGDPKLGGPASYKSVAKAPFSDGTYPLHRIGIYRETQPKFGSNGKISIELTTIIRDKVGNVQSFQEPTIPLEPQELYASLKSEEVERKSE